jgi:tetratricopeptide (TPR) repeat protein
LAVSCSDDNIDTTLDRVESIVVRQPDSALILLNSLKNPYNLTNFQRARHTILTLYAKDLSFKDNSLDTMIFQTIDYLKTVNNPKYLALAEYYLGRMYQAQGQNDHALKLYLDAKSNAEKTENSDIKGLICYYIGEQYYMKREYGDAIDCFKSALEYFNKSQGNSKRKISVINSTGNCLLLTNKNDKAIACYNEAFKFAVSAQDSAHIMQNLGMAYLHSTQYREAKQQLFQALNLNSDSILQGRIYCNLSTVYEKENTDSAVYFAKLSLLFAGNDDNILLNNYKTLLNVEKTKGNYENALKYYRQYTNCLIRINTKINQHDISKIERDCQAKMFSDKNNDIMKKIAWTGAVILLFFVGMTIFVVHLCRKNSQYKVILQEKDIELKNTIACPDKQTAEIEETKAGLDKQTAELQNKLSGIETKEKMLSTIIHNSIRKITLFDHCTDFVNKKLDAKKFKSITKNLIPQNNEQINFYDDLNILYNNIFQQIKLKYSEQLTEQEFKIVYLIYAGFDNTDITWLLSLNKHVVEQKKSKIREKLNIGYRGDIKSFFVENLK